LLGGHFLIFHVLFASKPDYPDSRTEALEDIFYYAVVNRVDPLFSWESGCRSIS
jgi:hypothetical protein